MAYLHVYFYDDDAKSDPSSLCFEVLETLTVHKTSFFDCFQPVNPSTSEPLNSSTPQPQLYEPVFSQVLQSLIKLGQSLQTSQVTFEDVYTLFEELNGKSLEVGEISHQSKDKAQGAATRFRLKISEKDGVFFIFRLKDQPLVVWRAVVYNASPEYLKLELSGVLNTHELFIQRVFQPSSDSVKVALSKKYEEAIKNILFSTPVIADPQPLNLPPVFEPYLKADVLSFPIFAGLIQQLFESPGEGFGYTKLSSKEDLDPDSLGPGDFFFVQKGEKIESLGASFAQFRPEEVSESLVDASTVEETMNRVMGEYLSRFYNKFELTFGISSIHRKMFVRVFNFEDESYKSFLLVFATQFFVSEFLVPYSSFREVRATLSALASEVHSHHHEVVLSSEQVTEGGVSISAEQILSLLEKLVQAKKLHVCRSISPDQPKGSTLIEFRAIRKFKIDQYRSPPEPVSAENCAKKQKVAISVSAISENAKPAFQIQIFENEREAADGRPSKALNSQYKFFKKYPYEYLPVLEKYLESVLNHYHEGEYLGAGRRYETQHIFAKRHPDQGK